VEKGKGVLGKKHNRRRNVLTLHRGGHDAAGLNLESIKSPQANWTRKFDTPRAESVGDKKVIRASGREKTIDLSRSWLLFLWGLTRAGQEKGGSTYKKVAKKRGVNRRTKD